MIRATSSLKNDGMEKQTNTFDTFCLFVSKPIKAQRMFLQFLRRSVFTQRHARGCSPRPRGCSQVQRFSAGKLPKRRFPNEIMIKHWIKKVCFYFSFHLQQIISDKFQQNEPHIHFHVTQAWTPAGIYFRSSSNYWAKKSVKNNF